MGGPWAVLALIARDIQELVTLKALVLLDAGEGVIVDALKQIDLEMWSSIKVLFSPSQILLILC